MTTRATATLQAFADTWEGMFASAIFSGIVGDAEHVARGGYHVSIADNPAGNYSITRKDDAAPPGTWPRDCASAVDMNLGLSDMKTCHLRLRAVFDNRAADPRAKYINAWNGWDGQGNAGRYDMVTGSVVAATDDHKWHMHLEFRRRYVNSADATAAVLSILSGESTADYQEGLNMPTAAEIADAVWAKKISSTWLGVTDRTAADWLKYADAARRDIATLAGKDLTDEQAIVQGVLAGLAQQTPEQTAAALRAVLGDRAAEVGRLLATAGSAGA